MIIQGDCLIELKKLPSNTVDSIVTDPPYELGFMGKSWDKTGIANNVLMWNECLRVLKPGGHLLAFSGTRTYHRMAVAIEDAGFEVRDMIEWVYGSGFPKSLNIGKAVDKLQGNEREKIGKNPNHRGDSQYRNEYTKGLGQDGNITKGTSKWEGWGTALKPAHEPICMARKPLDRWWKIKDCGKKVMGKVMTVAENVLKYGTGGINIDESRVEATKEDMGDWDRFKGHQNSNTIRKNMVDNKTEDFKERVDNGVNNLGRFPANLIHDNSEEVRECFPETKSGGGDKANKKPKDRNSQVPSTIDGGNWQVDLGNASRFFKSITSEFNPSYTNGTGDYKQYFKSIIYNPKASKSERNKGCEELYWLEGKQIDKETYKILEQENATQGTKHQLSKANNHCTVKSVALMEYLIKMVTPKSGTVLDPFMGSGSIGVAAKKNGYDFIGIELDKEYCKIAEKRINGK